MKKHNKSTPFKANVLIHLQEINLEHNYNAIYYIITEIVNGKPLHTYCYEIPESYKDSRLLGKSHERYNPYSPN